MLNKNKLENIWVYALSALTLAEALGNKLDHIIKNGQGQHSVIIWTSLVVLEYSILYTKFQCHRPLGSEEGHFWMFLLYMGLEAILLCDSPWTFEQTFIRLHRKFGFKGPKYLFILFFLFLLGKRSLKMSNQSVNNINILKRALEYR